MPRYVLLRHECPAGYRSGPHWDLMLESNGVLLTWELLELPATWAKGLSVPSQAGDAVQAHRLNDHRLDYLEIEGPLSGDRGSVQRVAKGTLEWLKLSKNRCRWRFGEGSLVGVAETNATHLSVAWLSEPC